MNDFRNKYGLAYPEQCPYCGYIDVDIEETNDNLVCIVCKNCGLHGPVKANKKEAFDAWNNQKLNSDMYSKCLFCGETIKERKCNNCGSLMPSRITVDKAFCCYIDLLGFSNYTEKYSLKDCAELINSYACIYQNRIISNDFKSFLFFVPFSDGIFIVSLNHNEFIKDLCKFCLESFRLKSLEYRYPKNKSDVSEVEISVISPMGVYKEQRHWFPAIFSGGISFGELGMFTQEATYCNKKMQIPNLLGRAVTQSVHLPNGNHGARIFCDKEFVDKLTQDSKNKYIFSHNKIFELYWPIEIFTDENDVNVNLCNGVSEIFDAILNFYVQYKDKDEKVEIVYFNTLKIVYFSQVHYFEYRNADYEIKNRASEILIEKFIHSLNISETEDLVLQLKDPDYWM